MVGAGALGCAALLTLAREAASTPTRIALVDFDDVELSNLQRQVLYDDADIGRRKVDAAAARLEPSFGVAIETVAERFDRQTGPALVAGADIVVDATDDPATKFLIARLCTESGTPSVYAGVARTGGQWMLTVPGESACLACVFPERAASTPTAEGCAALGILAPVAGFVGSMQAITALAFLQDPRGALGPDPRGALGPDPRGALDGDASSVRAGRLHLYELTGRRSHHVDFPIDDACGCRSPRTHASVAGRAARTAAQTQLEERTS